MNSIFFYFKFYLEFLIFINIHVFFFLRINEELKTSCQMKDNILRKFISTCTEIFGKAIE